MDVSVVIPAYNPGTLLDDQLRALAQQTFAGTWEVVVADNGTTDGSLDGLAGRVAGLDLRVVDASARSGPSYARNTGVREARGDWVALCDADDVVAPGWLEALFAARDGHDVVSGAMETARLNPAESVLARGRSSLWTELRPGPCNFLPIVESANLLVRRADFLELGGFDESMPNGEDVDFSWRAQLAGLTLGMAPDAVVHYRFRPTPLGAYRQMVGYESAHPNLFRLFRDRGARRDRWWETAARAFWVVTRSPYAFMGLRRRYVWFCIAGGMVGRLKGSWRYRTLYL
jgi:glycosyltransferase involved in cell wall biosynthesis